MDNISLFASFTLLELKEVMTVKYTYFTLSLAVYFIIIGLNVILIVTIFQEKTLHEPMYIFLCNLCINGLFGTTGFYPKFLSDLISNTHLISYSGCFMQFFVIYTSVLCEFTTLTVMAYDRYVAICRPLDYHSIMTKNTLVKLLLFCWILPAFSTSAALFLTNNLTLCGSHIDKLYCDNLSMVKLSCEPAIINNVYGFIVIVVYFSLVILIICSYCKLISACIKSAESKTKFMQTCLPHLLSLINFTVALLFDTLYVRYGSRDFPQGLRNFLALEFLIIPPIFNPLIYGLKMTEVRKKTLTAMKAKVTDPLCSVKKG